MRHAVNEIKPKLYVLLSISQVTTYGVIEVAKSITLKSIS
jgi:hypothetical protein